MIPALSLDVHGDAPGHVFLSPDWMVAAELAMIRINFRMITCDLPTLSREAAAFQGQTPPGESGRFVARYIPRSIASNWSRRARIVFSRSKSARPNAALRWATNASCSRFRTRPAGARLVPARSITLAFTAVIWRSRLASFGSAQIAFSTGRRALAQSKLGLL